MVVDHLTKARKLSFLKAGLISRLLITLLSLAFSSPDLWVATKFSFTPNSFNRSGHITVFKTRDMLLTVFTREFLVRVLWKKFSLRLGRLERANSQGGDLKLDWALEETRGHIDFWMRCSLPTCVNLWAISDPASTVDQVQGRHGQGVEQARQVCSVGDDGGVHEGVPFITDRYTSSLAGIFISMKYACPCLHSLEFITVIGSSITLLLASAQLSRVLTWE